MIGIKRKLKILLRELNIIKEFYIVQFYIYEGKVKISRPSLRETRDKRLLGRDLNRSWCHCHTSLKLFLSQSMDPWSKRQHSRMLPSISMEPWAAIKQGLLNTKKYHVFAPMGRFQLESIYLYFPPSSQLLYLFFCPVGLSLL